MNATETFAARTAAVMSQLPDFGDDLYGVELRRLANPEPDRYVDADVHLSVFGDGDRNETLAAEILAAHPAARLERLDGPFVITRSGSPSWSVYFSRSACVKVQTGVRTVTEPDPDAVAALPLVTREEPVYEWRCADPLAEMVAAVSA